MVNKNNRGKIKDDKDKEIIRIKKRNNKNKEEK